MKAVVCEKFGPPEVLQIKEIEKPIILQEDQLIVKIFATSVNTLDIGIRSGGKGGGFIFMLLARLLIGIRKPKRQVLGIDFSGEIVEIGMGVTVFKVGDKVFGGAASGANAEFSMVRTNRIAKMPSNMSYLDAGVVPGSALSALQALKKGNIEKGHDVLIYGASGGMGSFAVQIAKAFGATVTAVTSGKNKQLIKSLGADYFVDYTEVDFLKQGKKYDLIFDAVGKSRIFRWKKALKAEGTFVNAGSFGLSFIPSYFRLLGNKFRKKKFRSFTTHYIAEDLEFLAKLYEEHKLKSVIDKSFSFEE